jgi:hypothetical protein
MVDTSVKEMRCRATKEIRSHRGLMRRYSEGASFGATSINSGGAAYFDPKGR